MQMSIFNARLNHSKNASTRDFMEQENPNRVIPMMWNRQYNCGGKMLKFTENINNVCETTWNISKWIILEKEQQLIPYDDIFHTMSWFEIILLTSCHQKESEASLKSEKQEGITSWNTFNPLCGQALTVKMLIFWSCRRDRPYLTKVRPIVFPIYLSASFFKNVLVPKLHFAEVSTTVVFKLSRSGNSTTETLYWTNFSQNILNQKNPSTTMVFVGSFCHLNKCVINADENRSLQSADYQKHVYKLKIITTSLLLLCRQTHLPPHNQLPPQELTTITAMTQSCEETKPCQQHQRNLPNLFFSSSLLFHLSELGCSKQCQSHKEHQTLDAINTSV